MTSPFRDSKADRHVSTVWLRKVAGGPLVPLLDGQHLSRDLGPLGTFRVLTLVELMGITPVVVDLTCGPNSLVPPAPCRRPLKEPTCHIRP
jgi:hypothetical protein